MAKNPKVPTADELGAAAAASEPVEEAPVDRATDETWPRVSEAPVDMTPNTEVRKTWRVENAVYWRPTPHDQMIPVSAGTLVRLFQHEVEVLAAHGARLILIEE